MVLDEAFLLHIACKANNPQTTAQGFICSSFQTAANHQPQPWRNAVKQDFQLLQNTAET